MCTKRGGGGHDLKVLEGMEEANKRSEARKFYTTARRMKANFQPQTSIWEQG